MRLFGGIDVAKEVHWAAVLDDAGVIRLDRAVENTPAGIGALVAEPRALGGEVALGLDGVGGIAGPLAAMLAQAGFRLGHVPGLAVNRARRGTAGGEAKSDPCDARVIADQVRLRRDLHPVDAPGALDLELRLLVGRRRDLVDEPTRRLRGPNEAGNRRAGGAVPRHGCTLGF